MISLRVLNPFALQPGDLGLDVVDRKADVVHAELVQVADVWIGQRLRMTIAQQLDFGSRRDVLQDQRDMLGFDAWNTHVARERFSGDDDRYCFLEPKDREERLCTLDVPHDDCQMVETLHHSCSFRRGRAATASAR